ncbi:MAG: hypothetical protein GXP49_12560 [Deltaproteobacteria bacterium]|nr:hypothetical protein [Deltaproteobacteria bacterium]
MTIRRFFLSFFELLVGLSFVLFTTPVPAAGQDSNQAEKDAGKKSKPEKKKEPEKKKPVKQADKKKKESIKEQKESKSKVQVEKKKEAEQPPKLVPLEEMNETKETSKKKPQEKKVETIKKNETKKPDEEKPAKEKAEQQESPAKKASKEKKSTETEEVTFGPKSEESPAQGKVTTGEAKAGAEKKKIEPANVKQEAQASKTVKEPAGFKKIGAWGFDLLAAADFLGSVSSANGASGLWLPDMELAARSELSKTVRVYFRLNLYPTSTPTLLKDLSQDYDNMDGQTEKLEWDRFAVNEAWVELHGMLYTERLRIGRFASLIGRHNGRSFYNNDFVEQPMLYDGFFGGAAFDNGIRLGLDLPIAAMNGKLAFDAEVLSGDDFRPYDGSLRNSAYMINHPDIRKFNKRPEEGDLVYGGRLKADGSSGDVDLNGAVAIATGAWDEYGDLSTFMSFGGGLVWHTMGRKEKSELAAEVEYILNYSQLHGYRSADNKVQEGDVYNGGGLYGQVVYRYEGLLEGGLRFDYLGLPHQQKGYGLPDSRTIRLGIMAGVRPADFVLLKLQYSATAPEKGDAVHTGFLEAQFGFGWL